MQKSSLKIVSPAKLNLYLEIINRRPDGYHNLKTIFERIDLADEITLEEIAEDRIMVSSDSKEIPLNQENLVYKAASLLKENLSITRGIKIHIKKRIPIGAGLGGGSSNAAFTLLGLNKLWGLELSKSKLLRLAAKLGSDVPFFILEASFAWGESRGEKLKPLINFEKKYWHVLLVPALNVSTKEVYQELDRNLDKGSYLSFKSRPDFGSRRISHKSNIRIDTILFNRLEEAAFRKYPRVKELKRNLIARGLPQALMSGSGGAVFALVGSRKEGLAKANLFKRLKGVRIFVVKTI